MTITVNDQGQITLPEHIRDSANLGPGSKLDIAVNHNGEVVLRKQHEDFRDKEAEFDRAIGSATIKWNTDELMAILRGED